MRKEIKYIRNIQHIMVVHYWDAISVEEYFLKKGFLQNDINLSLEFFFIIYDG